MNLKLKAILVAIIPTLLLIELTFQIWPMVNLYFVELIVQQRTTLFNSIITFMFLFFLGSYWWLVFNFHKRCLFEIPKVIWLSILLVIIFTLNPFTFYKVWPLTLTTVFFLTYMHFECRNYIHLK